jgi:uncharacterized membrane protein (DUF4010 family)
MIDVPLGALAVALGIGLLIGIERERSRRADATPGPAGVRTFTLAALFGALAIVIGGDAALLAFGLVTGAFAALAYRRTGASDPGLTTEIALVVTYLLGALALRNAPLAAGIGVVVTILLVSRSWLHEFVRHRLTASEVSDALLLAAAALVVLPLIPDRTVDPWHVLNLRVVWTLAVAFMAINGVGYLALRALGPGRGLPLAGFASGFVSSSAAHGAMGARARDQPALLRAAVAGAALSSVATVVQLAIVLGVADPALLARLLWPLAASGAVAALYGALFTWRSWRERGGRPVESGRAFSPTTAIAFALLMSAVIVGSALCVRGLGASGAVLAAAVAGFADTHSSAASAASLSAASAIGLEDAALAVLAGFTTNAVTKSVLAAWSGGPRFLARLLPGLALMVAAAWMAYAATYP